MKEKQEINEINLLKEIIEKKYNSQCNCVACSEITRKIKKQIGEEKKKAEISSFEEDPNYPVVERIEGLFEENPPITERQLFIECMKWFAVGFLLGFAVLFLYKFNAIMG